MNKEKFLYDFTKNGLTRQAEIVNYCFQQNGWFKYDDLLKNSVDKAILRHQDKNYYGKPRESKRNINHLLLMGFLLADTSEKKLKVNPDFIPLNQLPPDDPRFKESPLIEQKIKQPRTPKISTPANKIKKPEAPKSMFSIPKDVRKLYK